MPCQPTEVHIISHTHWDREWYQPFQGFRRRLVGAIDELLDIMERDPEYRYFWLDGQTIVLEDYLEVRPENEGRLRALIAAGRIEVGPWYVQPDEALVSGEALIRNLLVGHRLSEAYGGRAAKVGYVPDTFGHTSQLPQILAGFGIDNAFLWRGLHGEGCPSEMVWEGPDGSRVLVERFGEHDGYVEWHRWVREPFAVDDPQPEQLVAPVTRFLDYKGERATVPVVLAMDGADHSEADPRLPAWLALLHRSFPGVRFVHSTPEQFLARIRPLLPELPVVRGELREPSKAARTGNEILNGVLSSRMPLKQRNETCQTLLERWAEPAASLAAVFAGAMYPRGYLRAAWRSLLQNHAHDSICGCSLDRVHQDMVYRFDQAHDIAEETAGEALRALAQGAGQADEAPGDHQLVVFNPNPAPYDGVALVDLELPAEPPRIVDVTSDPYRYYLYVSDAEGRPVPCQLTGLHRREERRERVGHGVWRDHTSDRFTVAMPVSVPAWGYATYTYERRQQPTRTHGSMAVGPLTWEGRWLRLSINPDGSLNVFDRASGAEFTQLLAFEDVGDVGDGYLHILPLEDSRVTSAGAAATVAVECEGPLYTRLRVSRRLRVPARLAPGGLARSREEAELPVTVSLDFPYDAREIACRAEIENTARDHVLRALFPSGLAADHFYTDTAFDMVRRPVERPDHSHWHEQEDEMVPQQSLVAVHDGRAGLAVFSRGLPAVNVRADSLRTVALTLLRAYERIIYKPGEGGQVLGAYECQFAIAPFRPSPGWEGALCRRAAAYRTGLRTLVQPRASRRGPARQGFLSVEPAELQLSALKGAENEEGAYILRLYNPTGSTVRGRARFERAPTGCWLADLGEQAGKSVTLGAGGEIPVEVGPRKIVTLLLRW